MNVKSLPFLVLTIVFAAIFAATVAIAFLVTPDGLQNAKFGVSLGALIFAEALVYASMVLIPAPKLETARGVFRVGATTASMGYFGSTVVMAFVAMSSISFAWLLALHLLVFVGTVVAAGSLVLGTAAIQASIDDGNPHFAQSLRGELARLLALLARRDDPALAATRADLQRVHDSLLTTPVPASVEVQQIIQRSLTELGQSVQATTESKEVEPAAQHLATRVRAFIQSLGTPAH
jgi:hypothetical protein